MDSDRNDMLMKFVRSSGQALDADCEAQLSQGDTLTSDFAAGKFFEITNFGFGAGLAGDDAGADTAFARFLAAASGNGRRYPVDIDVISFSRKMDRGSTLFFQDTSGVKMFDSAALVKRRSVGDASGPQSYLRVDFSQVLMIGLDWTDDEQITETYRFVCRGVKVAYKPQNRDGSLGAAISGAWPAAK